MAFDYWKSTLIQLELLDKEQESFFTVILLRN